MKAVPKFRINQIVNHRPNLYGETSGRIIDRERLFSELDETGKINRGGLNVAETNLPAFSVPWEFTNADKTELTIVNPAGTFKYRFTGWTYTVQGKKHLTGFPERMLRAAK